MTLNVVSLLCMCVVFVFGFVVGVLVSVMLANASRREDEQRTRLTDDAWKKFNSKIESH